MRTDRHQTSGRCTDRVVERSGRRLTRSHRRADLLDIDPTDPDTLANGASFTLDTDAGPVDRLNNAPGAEDYADLRARSAETSAAGVIVRAAGPDDLIRMKRASRPPQDLRDIANLLRPSETNEQR